MLECGSTQLSLLYILSRLEFIVLCYCMYVPLYLYNLYLSPPPHWPGHTSEYWHLYCLVSARILGIPILLSDSSSLAFYKTRQHWCGEGGAVVMKIEATTNNKTPTFASTSLDLKIVRRRVSIKDHNIGMF